MEQQFTSSDINLARQAKPPATKNADRRPSIYDLADIAEVSAGTVSRVLNNLDNVKDTTRERVLRAALAMKIRPRTSTRLRKAALLLASNHPRHAEGYSTALTSYIASALSDREVDLVIPSNPIEQIPRMFLNGLIVATEDKSIQSLAADLAARIPVVYIDGLSRETDSHAVASDHFAAGRLAGQHFVARGRKKPAFLAPLESAFSEKLRGFEQALHEANIAIDRNCFSLYGADTSQVSMLARIVRCGADAIYVPGSNYQAMECLHLLTYVMGIKVPSEIALIGSENEGLSALLFPPLTTIEEPIRELAIQAAEMLHRLTSGQDVPVRKIIVPVHLIDRASVA